MQPQKQQNFAAETLDCPPLTRENQLIIWESLHRDVMPFPGSFFRRKMHSTCQQIQRIQKDIAYL